MTLFGIILVLGCTQMPDPGAPFSQVELKTVSAEALSSGDASVEEAAPDVDPEFADMQQELDLNAPSQPEEAEQEEGDATEQAEVVDSQEEEPPAVVSEEEVVSITKESIISSYAGMVKPSGIHSQGATALQGWPVHLVTTVMESSPPLAVLGLPDGQKVVVTPGQMLADQGLVVIAVGPNTAELARIKPQGDRAAVESLTLSAQF